MSSSGKQVPRGQHVLNALKLLIQREAQPGDRLPSVRQLSIRFQTSPVTISNAFAELTRLGLIITRPGAGTFVAARTVPTPSHDLAWQTVALPGRADVPEQLQALLRPPLPHTLPLGDGYLDETLMPLGLLQRSFARVSRRPGIWSRQAPEGLEALRSWFAQQLGGEYRASDVLIVPGGQAALSTLLRALVPPGGGVVVESPTYFGMLAVARAAGVQTIPVPADEDGIRADLLETALKSSGAKLVYLQPLYANPTGAVLSAERRESVLKLAEQADAFIVEDDYARDLTLDGTAPQPLATHGEGRVIYLRSLTKVTAPSLRVAALIARGPVLTRLRNARAIDELFLAGPMQEMALEVVTSPEWNRHLKTLRTALRLRRDGLLAALARDWPQAHIRAVPRGGYNLWVGLPEEADDLEFVARAAQAGVQLSAGSGFFPAEPPQRYVRLSYSAASIEMLEEAARRTSALLNGSNRVGRGQQANAQVESR